MTPSKVDIHMVTWHRPTITELAIRTIGRNTKPSSYRLVVYDNGSKPEMQKMLQDLHENGHIDELILSPTNRGLEHARNHMLKHCATGEYFICADNDCLPNPIGSSGDWIEQLVELMQKYPKYAAISCRTQVMIGTGNIYDGHEDDDIVDFPHPGGSLRIMRTTPVREVGGWAEERQGRGAEERYIGAKLHEAGYKTAFAVKIPTLHLFGVRDQRTDRWGYPVDWKPEDTGHSDIWHPVLENGDDFEEVKKFAGEENAQRYFAKD